MSWLWQRPIQSVILIRYCHRHTKSSQLFLSLLFCVGFMHCCFWISVAAPVLSMVIRWFPPVFKLESLPKWVCRFWGGLQEIPGGSTLCTSVGLLVFVCFCFGWVYLFMRGVREDVNKSGYCQMFGCVLTGFGVDSLNSAHVYVFRKLSGMSLQISVLFGNLCVYLGEIMALWMFTGARGPPMVNGYICMEVCRTCVCPA